MTEVAQPDEASARLKFHIKTFTGRYIPVEDRLRLDAVDVDGNRQSLFMTRRLVDPLYALSTLTISTTWGSVSS